MATFNDDVGHLDAGSTRKFVKDRFWSPGFYRDVKDYVRSCHGFQHARKLPTYYTRLRAPVTGLLQNFSIDFTGPLKHSKTGKRFVLVASEHLTGWLIAGATEDLTAGAFVRFTEQEIIIPLELPRMIV